MAGEVASRLLISCTGLDSTSIKDAQWVFEQAFREYGLPRVMRTDNGSPFASCGLHGLSRLSVWWMRLGIKPERIEPGKPQQNGQHERMHLTLKEDATRPSSYDLLHQQERFDTFQQTFNEVRPHESLGMRRPKEFYQPSERPYPKSLDEPTYPLHDLTSRVYDSGHLLITAKFKVYISTALSGQQLGLREIEPRRWLVSYMDLDLGLADEATRLFTPTDTHSGPS